MLKFLSWSRTQEDPRVPFLKAPLLRKAQGKILGVLMGHFRSTGGLDGFDNAPSGFQVTSGLSNGSQFE